MKTLRFLLEESAADEAVGIEGEQAPGTFFSDPGWIGQEWKRPHQEEPDEV